MGGDGAVEVKGLHDLADDLRRVGAQSVGLRIQRGMKKVGELLTEEVEKNAAWSARIPASIRVTVVPGGVSVRVGGTEAPHAGVFEGTVEGRDRKHPVFARGNRDTWTWTTQPKRPYLRPALDRNADKIADIVADEMQAAFTDNGWRP